MLPLPFGNDERGDRKTAKKEEILNFNPPLTNKKTSPSVYSCVYLYANNLPAMLLLLLLSVVVSCPFGGGLLIVIVHRGARVLLRGAFFFCLMLQEFVVSLFCVASASHYLWYRGPI